MMKKAMIILNVILGLVFFYRLSGLYDEIVKRERRAPRQVQTNLMEINRPSLTGQIRYRNIFGIVDRDTKPIKGQHSPGAGSVLNPANELAHGSKILRISGIFIQEGSRFAVVSLLEKGKAKNNKPLKVYEGQGVDGYVVESILPDRVILKSPSSEPVALRVFKQP